MTWRQRRLSEMAELVNGYPFDSSLFRSAGGVPLVRIRDVLGDCFETFLENEAAPESSLIRNGDVVIGMDGDFNLKYWDRGRAALNQRLCLLRDNGTSDMRFLAYSLPTHLVEINDLTYATTVKHLSSANVRAIRLGAPDRSAQRAIADYLDRETARIDTLIEEQRRLIETLRERRTAVIHHSMRQPSSAASSLDMLGRTARIGNGSTPRRETARFWNDTGFPWLNSSVVNQSRVCHAEHFVTAEALQECHLPIVEPGSILVGLTGQGKTRGTATLLDIEATVSQHLAYVTPERSVWNSEYLLWALRGSYNELRRLSEENGSTKGGLTCEALQQFRLAVPKLSEQRRIAAHLDEQTAKIDVLIAETERFIELSRERRTALITAAVTGQIDVREMA